MRSIVIAAAVACCLLAARAEEHAGPARPDAIETDGVPELSPRDLALLRRYQEMNQARFVDWLPQGKGILAATRRDTLTQLHAVSRPGATPRALTTGDEPVAEGRALPDGAVLFTRGRGGDESFQIYRLDPSGGREKLLTDGRSRHLMTRLSDDGARLAFTSTRRNGSDADVYVLEPRGGGEPELVREVDGETWSLDDWSPDGARAILRHFVSRNESRGVIHDLAKHESTPIPPEVPDLAAGAQVARSDFTFGPGGRTVLFLSDARGEFTEIARIDLESGEVTWPAGALDRDVEQLEVSRDRRRAAFTVNAEGFSELWLLDGLDGAPAARQLPLARGLVAGVEFSPGGDALGLTLGFPSWPAEAHVLDLGSGELVRWTESERAGFDREDFVEPELFRCASFDGLSVPGFLFLPRAAAAGTAGRVPVIITIHGGPESQYRPWFSQTVQFWVRELGAAVIAPNVRGSTGYGKSYSLLDNGVRREDSVRDIGAILDWIGTTGARERRLDPGRVAVIGGSYGGYMVLASLLRFGERLRCGVDSVGISDFTSFLERTSGYRRHLRRAEYGDERDPQVRRFFERIAPARRIGELRSALLLIHGRNDPRVPFSETVQVVERARASGQPVWTVYAANEGHGFSRRENRDFEQAVVARFFREFLLGGR
jgi:dipeptidyl aminopeptidase/acylaminoacyl peptidase